MIDAPFLQPPDETRYTNDRRILLIADDTDGGRQAEEAIRVAGCRIVNRLDWTTAAAWLDDAGTFDLMMVETEESGADIEQLAATLPRIDLAARRADARVVVAMALAQIDLVTANLFGAHAQLLCAPSLAERVAALSLAGAVAPGSRLGESATEADSRRLQRLNEEVARIAETLARLTRRDAAMPPPARPDMLGDRRTTYGVMPASGGSVEIEPRDIRRAIRARRLRDQFFEHGLFEDPAWDMLLDLFAAELESRAVSVSSLCIAAAVAPTTALRWIGKMSAFGLLERRPDPFDRRRAYMALSETARTGMNAYCDAVKQAGLAIA